MKRSWIILGALLLLVASVCVLVYIFTQGLVTSLPWYLLAWLLVFGTFALVGAIAWLAGWLPRKRTPEPKPQGAVIETSKAAPRQRPGEETMERGSELVDIEGIGPVNAAKLNSVDIYTKSDLLEAGATPNGRRELAEKAGVSPKLVLEWVNIADLLRIKGVGEEYSDLLEEAGVDTVAELAKRVPENLHATMLEVNEKQKLVRRPPALNEVKEWIAQAKTLPRKVEY